VIPIALSPDGQLLASGSFDNEIKLWDMATRRELRTLSGHKASLRSLAFSPDGQRLASGSFDETIRIWQLSSVPRK
jgi:WD40 repeat protein